MASICLGLNVLIHYSWWRINVSAIYAILQILIQETYSE